MSGYKSISVDVNYTWYQVNVSSCGHQTIRVFQPQKQSIWSHTVFIIASYETNFSYSGCISMRLLMAHKKGKNLWNRWQFFYVHILIRQVQNRLRNNSIFLLYRWRGIQERGHQPSCKRTWSHCDKICQRKKMLYLHKSL